MCGVREIEICYGTKPGTYWDSDVQLKQKQKGWKVGMRGFFFLKEKDNLASDFI